MSGEELEPGLLTFAVPVAEARALTVGQVASIKDARGDPARGRVVRVKEGNRMAIVVLEKGDV